MNQPDSVGFRFFSNVRAAWERAADTCGEFTAYYRIAEQCIAVRCAGNALVPQLTTALSHLRCEPAAADLDIFCWDGKSTGVGLPEIGWNRDDCIRGGAIPRFSDKRITTHYHGGTNAFSITDKEAGVAVFAVDDAELCADVYQYGSPFRVIFNTWFYHCGLQPVHAAAVGTEQGGALLVGPSGSGKSTTALSCIGSLKIAAEDFAALDCERLLLYSYYSSAKLEERQLEQMPFLLPARFNPDQMQPRKGFEKQLLFLHEHYPESVISTLPIRVLLHPKVSDREEPRLLPISAAELLLALAPSSVVQAIFEREINIAPLAEVARSLPRYRLELCADFEKNRQCIVELLEQLNRVSSVSP